MPDNAAYMLSLFWTMISKELIDYVSSCLRIWMMASQCGILEECMGEVEKLLISDIWSNKVDYCNGWWFPMFIFFPCLFLISHCDSSFLICGISSRRLICRWHLYSYLRYTDTSELSMYHVIAYLILHFICVKSVSLRCLWRVPAISMP